MALEYLDESVEGKDAVGSEEVVVVRQPGKSEKRMNIISLSGMENWRCRV